MTLKSIKTILGWPQSFLSEEKTYQGIYIVETKTYKGCPTEYTKIATKEKKIIGMIWFTR